MADGVEENVAQRVNTLLSGELKLENVQVTSAERKPKFNNNDCGVIVAKCVNFADKQKVMEAKSKLRDSTHFSHIAAEVVVVVQVKVALEVKAKIWGLVKLDGDAVFGILTDGLWTQQKINL